MILRLREEDCETSLELTEFSFRLNLSASERARRIEQMKSDYVLGYYEDDVLAAKLDIIPFKMYLGGRQLSMGGIASVATWPEHRRKGMVGKLMSHSLQVMREKGHLISVLNPFSFVFYRKYGWGYFGEIKRYKFALGKTAIHLNGGHVERKTRMDLSLIQGVYEEYASQFNGMISRDEAWWECSVFRRKLGQLAVDFDEEGKPQGYVLYSIEGSLLDVKEFVHLDEFSRARLLRFLAMHDSMAEELTFTAPANDLLPTIFDTPPSGTEVNCCYMARIIDFAAFLQQYPFLGDGDEHSILLEVKDKEAAWNNGRFELSVSGEGIPQIKQLEADDGKGRAGALAGPIHVFSSLFMGYGKGVSYLDAGLLTGNRKAAEELDRLLSKYTPYILDMF